MEKAEPNTLNGSILLTLNKKAKLPDGQIVGNNDS